MPLPGSAPYRKQIRRAAGLLRWPVFSDRVGQRSASRTVSWRYVLTSAVCGSRRGAGQPVQPRSIRWWFVPWRWVPSRPVRGRGSRENGACAVGRSGYETGSAAACIKTPIGRVCQGQGSIIAFELLQGTDHVLGRPGFIHRHRVIRVAPHPAEGHLASRREGDMPRGEAVVKHLHHHLGSALLICPDTPTTPINQQ